MSQTTRTTADPGPASAGRHEGAVAARRFPLRSAVPLLGGVGVLLTIVALSGAGDLPAPYDEPASMAARFLAMRDDVLVATPFGILGAAAFAVFLATLARRLYFAGESGAAAAVVSGGVLSVGYFLFLYLVYSSISYQVASTSPEATKALFVPTILAVPVFGLGAAVTLAGAAYGATRSRLLPRWWSVLSVAGAGLAALAIFCYAANGFFSPDVQQQTAGNAFFVWMLATSGALFTRDRRAHRS